MKLTIAIPTIESRRDSFECLYLHLSLQAKNLPVEIISICDNKEISIGLKRQKLLEMAKGEYVVMIDDDDWVAGTYVKDILEALEFNPDCVGFQIECSGTPGVTADMSRKYTDWLSDAGGFDYVRTPYQKTPTRTSIALAVGYEDRRYGEDYDYSVRLRDSGLIKVEAYIPKVLYYYRFHYEDPRTKFGM